MTVAGIGTQGETDGFSRTAVHPAQVATVNAVFTLSAAEIERAAHVLEVFREAEASGCTAIKESDGN